MEKILFCVCSFSFTGTDLLAAGTPFVLRHLSLSYCCNTPNITQIGTDNYGKKVKNLLASNLSPTSALRTKEVALTGVNSPTSPPITTFNYRDNTFVLVVYLLS